MISSSKMKTKITHKPRKKIAVGQKVTLASKYSGKMIRITEQTTKVKGLAVGNSHPSSQ